jgi:hypothetical protein
MPAAGLGVKPVGKPGAGSPHARFDEPGMGNGALPRTLRYRAHPRLYRRRQADRKTREGAGNPDRDARFHFINDAVQTALAENQPVISVDTKKKELVDISGTLAANGGPRARPKKYVAMTF